MYMLPRMPNQDHLGQFEMLVLTALERLGEEAYGVTIRREIEAQCGRAVSIGAVYATLGRLGDKGYVTFWVSGSTPVQGGRARKHARITPTGRRVLRESIRTLERMLEGLDFAFRHGRTP
jgi:PadR family transcriptional regulator PadR